MTRLRVAILISGGGTNMLSLINSMTGDHPARPVLVLSSTPEAGGLEKAQHFEIPTAFVDHRDFPDARQQFEAKLNQALRSVSPDIICLAGFMRILSAEFVESWHGNILNIHPSLLPKYRGLSTHRRALAAGDHFHGCTVHRVTGALDDGPILGQSTVPVTSNDTEETLAARVLAAEHILYPEVLRRVASGNKTPVIWP
ncbi:MAG: phosphoribosylglycinamide formyltransferase [Alphaproteobacteria bacterium]|nr:phosphoribosylglycinamide formyltransferase [Alphaproteobacteria bacterium]